MLDLLTEEELVRLNQIIVARLRLMHEIKAHGAMMNFRPGQRVRFAATSGELIRGVIAKYNRKSVTVVTEAGAHWRVSPGLLEAE